ncbi:MAG: cupin domain-containing protein, partial [Pseudomonadota bacterium]
DTPIHKHTGAVEAYVLDGEFGYGDQRGAKGAYTYEAAGSIHQPDSPGGSLMFAIVHGPIIGYTEDGQVEGVVDNDLMYELAAANGAADHIVRTPL